MLFGFLTGTSVLGKELNKLKNKGLLAESMDDKQTDESIGEGEKTVYGPAVAREIHPFSRKINSTKQIQIRTSFKHSGPPILQSIANTFTFNSAN